MVRDIELAPWPLGCDPGTTPTFAGGALWVVWRGELYQLTAGEYRRISQDQLLPGEKIVQAVIDTSRDYDANIVVRVEGNQGLKTCWRYFFERGWWMKVEQTIFRNNFGSFSSSPIGMILPNSDGTGVRFLDQGGNNLPTWASAFDYAKANPNLFIPSLPPGVGLWPFYPSLEFENIDFLDQYRADKIHYMRVPTKKLIPSGPTMPKPRLYLNTEPSQEDEDYQAWVEPMTSYANELFFVLPHGRRSRQWDLKVVVPGMKQDSIIESPLLLIWSAGYRKRR
jgi:hypothetical protein